MISPRETQPYLQSAAGLVCKALMNDYKRMVNVCDGKRKANRGPLSEEILPFRFTGSIEGE